MNDPLHLFPATPEQLPPQKQTSDASRRTFLRRVTLLLWVACIAFVLTIWLLVRVENPASLFGFASGPSSIVRAHLDALNRGDLRAAYGLFSQHYRAEISFQDYHQLVVTHRQMFRTRLVKLTSRAESRERAVLDIRVVAADGESYRARFTMVRADGRWWIDDLRWAAETEQRTLIQI